VTVRVRLAGSRQRGRTVLAIFTCPYPVSGSCAQRQLTPSSITIRRVQGTVCLNCDLRLVPSTARRSRPDFTSGCMPVHDGNRYELSTSSRWEIHHAEGICLRGILLPTHSSQLFRYAGNRNRSSCSLLRHHRRLFHLANHGTWRMTHRCRFKTDQTGRHGWLAPLGRSGFRGLSQRRKTPGSRPAESCPQQRDPWPK